MLASVMVTGALAYGLSRRTRTVLPPMLVWAGMRMVPALTEMVESSELAQVDVQADPWVGGRTPMEKSFRELTPSATVGLIQGRLMETRGSFWHCTGTMIGYRLLGREFHFVESFQC